MYFFHSRHNFEHEIIVVIQIWYLYCTGLLGFTNMEQNHECDYIVLFMINKWISWLLNEFYSRIWICILFMCAWTDRAKNISVRCIYLLLHIHSDVIIVVSCLEVFYPVINNWFNHAGFSRNWLYHVHETYLHDWRYNWWIMHIPVSVSRIS